jgi:putative transposase
LVKGSLGVIVGAYKAAVTKRYRNVSANAEAVVWQRNYYEHVIRDDEDWRRIEAYIEENPRRWADDAENPQQHAIE